MFTFAARSGGAALALSACALVACGCGGKSAPKPERVVARQTATGRHASATASSAVGTYRSFSVRVSTLPIQRITGGWVVSCHVGTSSSRDSEDFRGRKPLAVRTDPLAAAEGCEFVATATLSRSGRVTLKILGSQ